MLINHCHRARFSADVLCTKQGPNSGFGAPATKERLTQDAQQPRQFAEHLDLSFHDYYQLPEPTMLQQQRGEVLTSRCFSRIVGHGATEPRNRPRFVAVREVRLSDARLDQRMKSEVALQPRRTLRNVESGFEVLKGLRQADFHRGHTKSEEGFRCQAWVVSLKNLLMNLALDIETCGDASPDALS